MFGLPGLLCTIGQNCPEDRPPVELCGPVGLKKFVRTSLHLSRSILGFHIAVHELCHDRRPEEVDGIVSGLHSCDVLLSFILVGGFSLRLVGVLATQQKTSHTPKRWMDGRSMLTKMAIGRCK